MSELDDLPAQAREADPGDRITLRDAIAAHGELAIEAMTDWLGDPRLVAFAIRVLERIGRQPAERAAVVDVLVAVDQTELPKHVIDDLDRSLMALGGSTIQVSQDMRVLRLRANVPGAGVKSERGRVRWGDDQAPSSATRLPGCRRARISYGWGSPLFRRAQPSSRGPAEMLPPLPSAPFQSRDRVRGDRPPSTVAMITGQASSVESNRARILLEGISLNEYPTAPSMQISVFSPGAFAYLPISAWLQSKPLTSGMKNSSSGSSFVRMSFALRGAPCGNDSRLGTALGRYHDEQVPLPRLTDQDETRMVEDPATATAGGEAPRERLGR